MYHNVSRGASPSKTAPRASKIDLENLEELQEAWCRANEMLRDPPPPPQLNSPRSLRACTLGDVNPQATLQKLSLKQHLFRVLGNPSMLSSLPSQASTEHKVLMQSALRSFQEAAVGLGTSQEKLAAYIAFENQEELRVPQLASLRELRRQLVAEEVFEERKRQHHRGSTVVSGSTGGGVASRHSSRSAGQRGSSAHSRGGSTRTSNNVLWSSQVEDNARSGHASATPHHDHSSLISGRAISPISAGPSSTHDGVAFSHRHPPSTVHQPAPLLPTTAASHNVSSPGVPATVAPPLGGRSGDLSAALSPSGKLPYTPRDVSSLNSSYFANRSNVSHMSNPSNALLPTTAATPTTTSSNRAAAATAATTPSPMPKKPALAQRHRFQAPPPPPPRPESSPPQQQDVQQQQQQQRLPRHEQQEARHRAPRAVSNVDHEVSLRVDHRDDSATESVVKQDLSVVSIDSAQLELLLNMQEKKATPRTVSSMLRNNNGTNGSHPTEQSSPKQSVKLFQAAAVEEVPPAVLVAAQTAESPSAGAPAPPPTGNASTTAAAAPATTSPVSSAISKATSSPASQPLTPRSRRGYTNPLDSPRQALRPLSPREAAAPTATTTANPPCTGNAESAVKQAAVVAEGGDDGAAHAPSKGTEEEVKSEVLAAPEQKTASSPADPPATAPAAAAAAALPLIPPPISQAEQADGFVYYCANPTGEVTKFYSGARLPVPVTVKL